MVGNQTILSPPQEEGNAAGGSSKGGAGSRATEKKPQTFTFDKSYWSAGDRSDPDYCSQQTLYEDLGRELLDHAFNGFNACIMAYGQTGSGKSYSMMGYGADKGIIPLTCEELFRRLDEKRASDPNVDFRVEVSYIEIYNEKVRDLLNPKNTGNLKVREHPSLGPYVEDLSKLLVGTYDEMITLMDEGNKARTVAATNMNETSSRSHSVFTLLLTMKRHDEGTNLDTEKVSRINLIDLAGSERANSTGATGQRLKEGANINKSLTTLGKVISSLAMASQAEGKSKGKKKAEEFVPYRDSVLTWLLKDSLGGNSKTAMIAAISPADYEETLSTLRYADQAKKIKNKAVVNEDPNAKLVRELKEELEMLRARVAGGGGIAEETYDPSVVRYKAKDGTVKTVTKAELQEQLESSEKLMQSLNETWEEKLQKTQEVHKEREKALEELGITVEKNMVGVHAPKKMPHLVNLNEDPLMSECLVYQLKMGRTVVGRLDSNKPAAIRLSGENILEEHCYFDNENGVVTLQASSGSITFLNGKQIAPDQPYKLKSGFRIILASRFRFNNPEEVRKQRDRQRLSLALTEGVDKDVSGGATPITRPDSPASSAADVDWNYAKREAALRLAGLDPDSMPDDQLDSLYEKITKVKSQRGRRLEGSRPESSASFSQLDDMWSEAGRPVQNYDAFTDDTSVVDNQNGTMYDEGSSVTGAASAQIKEMQGQLEAQRIEFENRLNALGEGPSVEAEDLKVEKDHMEKQLVVVQAQMKRLLEMRGRGKIDEDFVPFEPVLYSAKQLRLIRKVLDKWRAHRAFSMAETVLSNAVVVKEVNVISKELDKEVTYNFTIAAGGSLAAPVSALDTIAGLDEFGDVADPVLASATQPSVGVKVVDKAHNAIYVWSLDRLQQQLQKMRNLTTYIDRPQYSQHFSSAQPFYDSPAPEYSFIGNALISLAPLARKLSATSTVPIFCRYTAEAIGSCRVDLKVASVTAPVKRGTGSASSTRPSTRAPSPINNQLQPGCKVNFLLSVDQVKGLGSNDFSSVHLQIRLASLAGPSLRSQEVFHSPVVDLTKSGSSELKFRRTFQLAVTSKILAHMREGYAPIEFFAALQPTYLERMERWDEMREQRYILPKPQLARAPSSSGSSTNLPSMRRSENDFVVEQAHDVIAWLSICELGSDGQYKPVPVLSHGPLDPGSFSLHQGLQRKLNLNLWCNAGKQLPWVAVTKIKVGNVRLLDAKGLAHESESKDMFEVKLGKQQNVEFKPDGTGTLSVDAPWDSSVHESSLLNRVTANGQRILLQIQWSVDIDTCVDPVLFSMDMAVTMQARDAGTPSRFVSMFSSTKRLSKSSSVFRVKLTPPLTRSAKDLWRLDTSEKYVRGEDSLGTWKPRGISVVEDYERLIATEKRSADVQAIKVILAASPPAPYSGSKDAAALLKESLELWQKKFGHEGRIVLSQDPEEDETTGPTTSMLQPPQPLKLVGQSKLMPRSDMSTRSGSLLLLTDAGENTWKKLWFVLRRPHLYIYQHSNELDEVGIISLTGVKVEHSTHMETLLGKPHIFTLFTSSNSHVFAAPNDKELQTWIAKLDPTRLPPAMTA
ncbi:Kinesin-like protein unc-104 AltName: Full=Protein immaculate connections; Short=DUnc104 [Serendipita indica DSM 11827]|nr:Kinesin-like protein unc-104 AltName: Full=Protein immaculate connections; Short=DUnc104 [Serendipita indica DSM 11827]